MAPHISRTDHAEWLIGCDNYQLVSMRHSMGR